MQLIPNYSLDASLSADSVRAVRDDSSSKIRLDATYSRKLASYNTSTMIYSVPEVRFIARRDVANLEGNPSGQRASADVAFRLPVAMDEASLDALLVDLRAYVNDAALKANLLKQALPTCCNDETE